MALESTLLMSLYDSPRAAALRSSMSRRSSVASSRLVVRTPVSSPRWRMALSTRSRAASSASWPTALMSLSMKLNPELAPRPRTAGGSTMITRASRIALSSLVARWATAAADCAASGRSLQGLRRTKPRAELWSPFRPETW